MCFFNNIKFQTSIRKCSKLAIGQAAAQPRLNPLQDCHGSSPAICPSHPCRCGPVINTCLFLLILIPVKIAPLSFDSPEICSNKWLYFPFTILFSDINTDASFFFFLTALRIQLLVLAYDRNWDQELPCQAMWSLCDILHDCDLWFYCWLLHWLCL